MRTARFAEIVSHFSCVSIVLLHFAYDTVFSTSAIARPSFGSECGLLAYCLPSQLNQHDPTLYRPARVKSGRSRSVREYRKCTFAKACSRRVRTSSDGGRKVGWMDRLGNDLLRVDEDVSSTYCLDGRTVGCV